MKATAQKQRETFTVVNGTVNSEPESQLNFKSRPGVVRRGMHFIHTINTVRGARSPRIFGLARLTAIQVTQVNHATIREGESHRIWPPNVLRQFNKAEVITKSRVQHYELKDSNVNRVC